VLFLADVVARRFPSSRARQAKDVPLSGRICTEIDIAGLSDNENFDGERRLMGGYGVVGGNLPLPIDFTRMTFARYCPDPLIAKLNPAFDGVRSAFEFNEVLTLERGDQTVELVMNLDVPEIRSISANYKHHTLSLTFEPAFPNLRAFTGSKAEGRFEISGDPSTGFIRGGYGVALNGDRLEIELIPSEGWIPNADKLSLRFLFSVEPMFKQWPTTYRWTAKLGRETETEFRMRSDWERTDTVE
jgi:hypothetical protein